MKSDIFINEAFEASEHGLNLESVHPVLNTLAEEE